MNVFNWAGYGFLVIGSCCVLIGAVGIIRLPDLYNRLHASTVAAVGGVVSIILGAGLLNGPDLYLYKAVIITVLIFMTAPIAVHAIAGAAYHIKVSLDSSTAVDELHRKDKK